MISPDLHSLVVSSFSELVYTYDKLTKKGNILYCERGTLFSSGRYQLLLDGEGSSPLDAGALSGIFVYT